tara:strand:- start:3005 stop:3868 length:864 start_codon:yes stop_codon:yes gene_type:complete
MSEYKQKRMLIDTELDELGRRKSLNRLENESLLNFKDRIYLCSLNQPLPNLNYYTFATNNHLNLFEKKVLEISLIDSMINENDLPRIEIKGNLLEIWKEKSKESVIKIYFDDPNFKFLKDIKAEIEKLDFLTVENLDYDEYFESKNLKQDSSDAYLSTFPLKLSKYQDFEIKYIEDYYTNNPIISLYEKESKESISKNGDFYLDKINGKLHTNQENKGFANITYQNFPFTIVYSPVKIIELNDESTKSLFYEKQINSEGISDLSVLNSNGADHINRVLEDNRLYWEK